MNITKSDLFKGCLIASLSHAIMTNKYPDLSYEQSWDNNNFSIQNSQGLRGTITFDENYCVVAVRNQNSNVIFDDTNLIQKIIEDFPVEVIKKAYAETLQYLLMRKNNTLTPVITSIFWVDNTQLYYKEDIFENLKNDFQLFNKIILPEKKAIDAWVEYYDMDLNAIELLKFLYQKKIECFSQKIIINEKQKKLIPGDIINAECIESLEELNIHFN